MSNIELLEKTLPAAPLNSLQWKAAENSDKK